MADHIPFVLASQLQTALPGDALMGGSGSLLIYLLRSCSGWPPFLLLVACVLLVGPTCRADLLIDVPLRRFINFGVLRALRLLLVARLICNKVG